MSETAALLGLPSSIQFEGKTIPLGECDFEAQGLFELHLEDEAMSFIRRHKATMTQAEWSEHMDGIRRDGAARVYSFGGAVAWNALNALPGTKYMAFLLLKRGDAEVDMELVERIFADEKAKDELYAKMWPRVYGPNLQRAKVDPTPPSSQG